MAGAERPSWDGRGRCHVTPMADDLRTDPRRRFTKVRLQREASTRTQTSNVSCPPTAPFPDRAGKVSLGARLCGNGLRFRCWRFHPGRSCSRIPKLGGFGGVAMHRFIDGEDRMQQTLLPHCLEDYVGEENPVRVIEVFIEELDLAALGFSGMTPAATGRPAYHPSTLLKIYLYGYLNRLQSSRRLEREAQRNIELMWLVGRLAPDFKTIADFRKDNGKAIRRVCREFIVLCRELKLFSEAIVAIDGSKFKAVNNRDKNFTDRKLKAQMQQLEESIARYMSELDRADGAPVLVTEARVEHIKEKVATFTAQMRERTRTGE